jgi:hypothetical protein
MAKGICMPSTVGMAVQAIIGPRESAYVHAKMSKSHQAGAIPD